MENTQDGWAAPFGRVVRDDAAFHRRRHRHQRLRRRETSLGAEDGPDLSKEKRTWKDRLGLEDWIYTLAKRRRHAEDAKRRVEDWIRVMDQLGGERETDSRLVELRDRRGSRRPAGADGREDEGRPLRFPWPRFDGAREPRKMSRARQ